MQNIKKKELGERGTFGTVYIVKKKDNN